MKLFIEYLILINLITFVIYGIDKWKATRQMWRIREATLLGLCFVGGAFGGVVGMRFFRHKTKKPVFKFGVPAMLLLQIALYAGGFLIIFR